MNNTKATGSKEISIISRLMDESVMEDLLEKYCIDYGGSIELIASYECDNDHVGLIVDARYKNSNYIERIIIDAVTGYPVTEQVFNVLYKIGPDCDKRIILYTEGSADFYKPDGLENDTVRNLINNLNRYGTNIFLVKMKGHINQDWIKYSLTARPPKFPDYDSSKLPSEAELREEEFWGIYFWQQFDNFYDPSEAFTGVLHGPREYGLWHEPDGGAEFYVKWTDQGLIFEAIDENYEIEYLESVLNSRKHELQMSFPDEEMTFIMKPGDLPKLQVKVWSTPVQSLVNTTISEKKSLAGEILEKFDKFRDVIMFSSNDLKNENIEEAKEAEQLVESE